MNLLYNTNLFKIILIVFIGFFAGCSAENSDSTTTLPTVNTADSYTEVEESKFSSAYTKMGYDYYNSIVKFNTVVMFDINSSESNSTNMTNFLSNLDDAILALDSATASYEAVDELNKNKISAAPSAYVNMSVKKGTTDSSRKLLSLYDSGLGPERLTLEYIAHKTKKSVKFLKALLLSIKSKAEADDWSTHADRMEDARARCEIVRDAAIAIDSTLATFAGVPVLAGAAAETAVTATTAVATTSKLQKIYKGAKVVYDIYSKAKTVEDVTAKSVRLVVSLGSADAPPAVPTFSGAFLDKHPILKKCDTLVSLATGLAGVKGLTKYERVAVLTDYSNQNIQNIFDGDSDASDNQVDLSSDGELKAQYKAQETTEIDKVLTPNTNAKNAVQMDKGKFELMTYIDNNSTTIDIDSVNPEIEFVDNLVNDEIVSFDANDKLLISDEYFLKSDDTSSLGKEISVTAQNVALTVIEDNKYSVSKFYNNLMSYAAYSVPTDISPSGTYTGSYTSITESDDCLPKGYSSSVVLVIDSNNDILATVDIYGTPFVDNGIAVDGTKIYDLGSADNVAWTGTINGSTITGNYTDLEDNCIGTFVVYKN